MSRSLVRRRSQRYLRTLTGRLTSDRGVLGAITANDLFWGTLADVPTVAIQRYLETVSEGIVVPAIVSLLTGFETELQAIALLAQWLFIASLFYLLTPRLFRRTAIEITQDDRFRLVTTVAALGFALVMAVMILDSPQALGPLLSLAGFLGAVGLSLGGYGWYFRAVQVWNTRSIEQRIDLLARFVPVPDRERAELRASSRATDLWSRVRVGSVFLALLIICTVSAFFLGLLSVLLLGLYPIGEVLVLASVGLNVIADRYGLPFGLEPPDHYVFDLEARANAALANTDTSIKGWMTLLLVLVCGLAFQILSFVSVLPVIQTGSMPFLRTAVDAGITGPVPLITAWNVVGMGLSFLTAILFGIWYWLRMLERVPAFLASWEATVDRHGSTDTHADTSQGPHVARPVGLMGPPALSFLITVLWLAFTPEITSISTLTTPDIAYALAWPVSLSILVASVWRTVGMTPQAPDSDTVAIPLSLAIQFGGEFAFLWIENIGTDQPPALTFSPFAVFLFLLVPWLFFAEDVRQWTRDREDVSEYLFVAYLQLFGVVSLVLGVIGTGLSSRVFLIFGGIVVILPIVLAIDEYFTVEVD